jgi:hypothetical protein
MITEALPQDIALTLMIILQWQVFWPALEASLCQYITPSRYTICLSLRHGCLREVAHIITLRVDSGTAAITRYPVGD